MVILDTNIIIDHLRQAPQKMSVLDKIHRQNTQRQLALSTISIQELYVGASTRNEKAEQLLLATLGPLKILPYTYEVAQLAGEIARDLNRPIELAEAAIAATAIVNNAHLLTQNIKDFLGINKLLLLE